MNRRGELGNVFDFLFILLALAIIVPAIYIPLYGNINANQKMAQSEIAEIHRIEAALNNLRIRLYEGEDLEGKNLDTEIVRSRILRGRSVSRCEDYLEQSDCDSDILNIHAPEQGLPFFCRWNNEQKKCNTERTVNTLALK